MLQQSPRNYRSKRGPHAQTFQWNPWKGSQVKAVTDWLNRLGAISQTRQPWLSICVSPWWAQVLLAAGARPATEGLASTATATVADDAGPGHVISPPRAPGDGVGNKSRTTRGRVTRPMQHSAPAPVGVERRRVTRALVALVGAPLAVLTVAAAVAWLVMSEFTASHNQYGITGGVSVGAETSAPSLASSHTATGPASVVEAYFAAIDRHDYQAAWDLGGKNLSQPYASFAAGFATVARDTVSVTNTDATTAFVSLHTVRTDGTQTTYTGIFTVVGGTITSANLHPWTGS